MKIFLYIFIALWLFMLVRTWVAYRNRKRIIDAIFHYHISSPNNRAVDYEDIEHYLKTFFRFYDFGCKHIVPKDKFKIIESYLK